MRLKATLRKSRQAICNNEASDAQKYDINLNLGDIVITASDGVFDNLFNREILDIIERYKRERYAEKKLITVAEVRGPPCLLSEPEEAKELSKRICEAARAKIDDGETGKRIETPYARLFKKTYNSAWEVSKSSLYN